MKINLRLGMHLCVFFGLIFKASFAFGWGANGHRVVGHIATSHLSEKAKLELKKLMGKESLARSSTWADAVRSHPNREYYGKFTPWHYTNIEDGQKYNPKTANPSGDILTALAEMERRLRDDKQSSEKKVEALRLLVHFMGDLHQPLHVGRKSDRGANWCYVKWFDRPKVNLHSVWDTELVEFNRLSYTELAEFINHPTPKQMKEWSKGTYLDWAYESMALRDAAYPDQERAYCKSSREDQITEDLQPSLGYAYQFKHKVVLERRLLQAGVRLANVLNSIFN